VTVVKICGITRQEDADAAARWGASMIGFVLYRESPRRATLQQVRDIAKRLPSTVIPVGVFVDPTPADLAAAAAAGIRVAQVHGRGTAWQRAVPHGIEVIRAVHLAPGHGDEIDPDISDRKVLLDAHDPELHGGTGRTVNWPRANLLARTRQVILAGGLTPSNVQQAIAEVRPFGVDVASGVEERPGIKDHTLLRAFIAAAKGTGT
jgi:phosphoribosylanthranilate isomerase